MKPTVVRIPVDEIVDWESFHSVFARVLGFPGFYGWNPNAWIDCMSYLDDPEAEMTSVHATPEGGLLLDLGICADFAARCPEQYQFILEGTVFVNYRRMDIGLDPLLLVSSYV